MNKQKLGLNRLQWISAGVLFVQIILAIAVSLPRAPRHQVAPCCCVLFAIVPESGTGVLQFRSTVCVW